MQFVFIINHISHDAFLATSHCHRMKQSLNGAPDGLAWFQMLIFSLVLFQN